MFITTRSSVFSDQKASTPQVMVQQLQPGPTTCYVLSLLSPLFCSSRSSPLLYALSYCPLPSVREETIKPLTSTQTDGQTGERMLHSLCTQTEQSSLGEADLFRAIGNKKKEKKISFPPTQPPVFEKYFTLFICRGFAEVNS